MAQNALLRMQGRGEIPVEDIQDCLKAINHAYSALLYFETVVSDEERAYRYGPPGRYLYWTTIVARQSWTLSAEQLSLTVPVDERLILNAVRLESPGIWEFLGTLNPLEVLRKYLNDRYDRDLGKAYRNEAERRKLELENLGRENEIIEKWISNAKLAGATDRDLEPLKNALIRKPLQALDVYQDRRIIGTAEILPIEDKQNPHDQ